MKEKEDKAGGDGSMEERILACAERLFLNKGYNLTSMTEIAREAGCTQALVHYYFRTKENLFSKIFEGKFHLFIDCIVRKEDENLPFEEIVAVRTSRLFDLMAANRRLPFVFLSEFIIKERTYTSCRDDGYHFEHVLPCGHVFHCPAFPGGDGLCH